LNLPNSSTLSALDTRQRGDDHSRLASNGSGSEFPVLEPATEHVATSAGRAANRLFAGLDKKANATVSKFHRGLLVATNAEGVVQQASGHAHSFKGRLQKSPQEDGMSTPFKPLDTGRKFHHRARFSRMSLF
jgi:hypothetical protein